MTARRAISSDSHTMEPGDLWAERLGARFRDEAPRVVDNENGVGCSFAIPGLGRQQISGAWALGKNDKDLTEHLLKSTMKDARPGGWDPAARLEDQDADGVEAEVLYSTLGLRLYPMDYPELQHACFQVYNDWLSEFCSYAPDRLHGIAMISLWDIERGAAELRRAADLGLKGGMIWASPPLSRPYYHRMYDPLWETAQELSLPLSLHIVSGMGPESSIPPLGVDAAQGGPSKYVNLIQEIQRSLADIVLGGVLERFPRLKIIAAECETGWLPHFLQRLDHANHKFAAKIGNPLSMDPSEYMKRQVWVTFLDDAVGAANAGEYGEHSYMWGNDYPHSDSTWPNSRAVIDRCFGGLPERVSQRILFDNTAELYHIDL